jgi:hypothetical protein
LQQRWWTLEPNWWSALAKARYGNDFVPHRNAGNRFCKRKNNQSAKAGFDARGVCTMLSSSGYYQLQGMMPMGWPHFAQVNELPGFSMHEQGKLFKDHILLYFEK